MKTVLALLLAAVSLVGVTGLAGCKKGGGDASLAQAKEALVPFTKPGADHAALFGDLRPKAEDYEAVFVGDAAAKAKAAMDPLFDSGKVLDPAADQTDIEVDGATPDQLAKQEGPATSCPAGYKDIADKINPKITVYCFRFVKPGDRGGLAGDALVFVNGHWAYFPKPFRWLR